MGNIFEHPETIPPKMLAILEGVISLRDQGMGITQMKVSDIAKEAGIGKGTVYEYFTSKEEIVVKAMIYDHCREIARLKELVLSASSFAETIDMVMDWMRDNMQKAFFLKEFIKIEKNASNAIRVSCEEIFGEKLNDDLMQEISRFIIGKGINDGVIKPPETELKQDMIISGVASALLYYLSQAERFAGYSYEDAKGYAKEMLFVLLGMDRLQT